MADWDIVVDTIQDVKNEWSPNVFTRGNERGQSDFFYVSECKKEKHEVNSGK